MRYESEGRLKKTGPDAQMVQRAADALFEACENYGIAENLAHALDKAAEDVGEADPQVHLLLSRIAGHLFELHDADVK